MNKIDNNMPPRAHCQRAAGDLAVIANYDLYNQVNEFIDWAGGAALCRRRSFKGRRPGYSIEWLDKAYLILLRPEWGEGGVEVVMEYNDQPGRPKVESKAVYEVALRLKQLSRIVI